MENKEQTKVFTVKDILIQTLAIILFVFILVWLFPTKSNVNNKLDYLSQTAFSTNIQIMKEAAIGYYTIERLPQEINGVERMTLKEMLNKKLLVDIIDGNGKKCNVNESYVEVVKLENEYQMKVNLSCSDNDAYIIVYLGCYDYCSASGICIKNEPIVITPNPTTKCSYEYEKVTDGKWGEYGSWSNWSVNRVSETDYRKVELKTETVLMGTTQVQTGTTTDTIDADSSTYEYCPDGYDISGDTCVKSVNGYYTAKCPTGYTLNSNGTCSGNVSSNTTVSPTCPDGYTRSGVKCYKVTSTATTATPTCPTGYTLSGSTCVGKTTPVEYTKGEYLDTLTGSEVPANTKKYYYETVSADYVWSCEINPCGLVPLFTYEKYTTIVVGGDTPTATPTCPTGYTLSGSNCIKPTTTTTSVDATCEEGTLVGELCYVTSQVAHTVSATCPTGYRLSGNKCYGTETSTTELSTTTSYSCSDSSYTLSGTKCTKAVPVYTTKDVYENVTYYRYKERTYISGTRNTEWSSSENDTYLISQGYNLTGNKKCY